MKWIDERSKQYSIEPAAIKNVSKDSNDNSTLDVFVYHTSYGTLEVQKQFVENYLAKPVDSIMKSRAKRDPLVLPRDYSGNQRIIQSTDPPNESDSAKFYDLMELFMDNNLDHAEFCEDLYENYQEKHMGGFDRGDRISFDDVTGELCLQLLLSDSKGCVKTLGMQIIGSFQH